MRSEEVAAHRDQVVLFHESGRVEPSPLVTGTAYSSRKYQIKEKNRDKPHTLQAVQCLTDPSEPSIRTHIGGHLKVVIRI